MTTYNQQIKLLVELSNRISRYNSTINESGIWFFLAALGCWSVSNEGLRLLAVAIAFAIFTHKIYTGIEGFRLFSSELREIEADVDASEMIARDKESLKFRANEIRVKKLGLRRILLHVPAYYLSGAFILTSLANWSGAFR